MQLLYGWLVTKQQAGPWLRTLLSGIQQPGDRDASQLFPSLRIPAWFMLLPLTSVSQKVAIVDQTDRRAVDKFCRAEMDVLLNLATGEPVNLLLLGSAEWDGRSLRCGCRELRDQLSCALIYVAPWFHGSDSALVVCVNSLLAAVNVRWCYQGLSGTDSVQVNTAGSGSGSGLQTAFDQWTRKRIAQLDHWKSTQQYRLLARSIPAPRCG